MKVVTTRAQVRAARSELGDLGFVPTMGYLHEGHLSLVRRARADSGAVAASIFVNPTQFGPSEDLASYPRDLERDLAALAAEGVDVVWTPDVDDVYPPGFSSVVDVGGVSEMLEGERRPGHFRGVATVCTILFAVTAPQRVYIGQKDLQQSVVLSRLVADLGLPMEVVVAPIVREPDGLAMSSRNVYLDPEQRRAARVLSGALRAARSAYAAGERDADSLRAVLRDVLATEPAADVDYVSVADPDSLTELEGGLDHPLGRGAASLAVRVGHTRLIDNTLLHEDDPTL